MDEKLVVEKYEWNDMDPDSSKVAWEYYREIYSGNHKLNQWFHLDIQRKHSIRFISFIKSEYGDRIDAHKFSVGGDVIFNFKDEKMERFNKIIQNDKKADTEAKNQTSKRLEKFAARHHQLYNFSLMPVSGGMNNYKGCRAYGLDRPDELFYKLKLFFLSSEDEKKLTVPAQVGGVNRECLSRFLTNIVDSKDGLGQFYEYINIFYRLDETMAEEFVKLGKEELDSCDRLNEYMDLAEKYWTLQINLNKTKA